MSKITGVVEALSSKDTSFGEMWNARVNGTNYGMGKFKPKFGVGDNISFSVTYNGKYANVDYKSLVVEPGTGGPAAPQKSFGQATKAAGGGMGKDDYWERKELKDEQRQGIISRQSALNSSLAFVAILAQSGALPAPAKAKDQVTTLENIVAHYRDKFLAEALQTDVVSEKEDPVTGEAIDNDDEESQVGW